MWEPRLRRANILIYIFKLVKMEIMSHFVVVPIQSGWQTKTKFFLWFEDMQKIYHWILEWGDLVVCISSNLDITLFFFKELDKTKYGQISVILLRFESFPKSSFIQLFLICIDYMIGMTFKESKLLCHLLFVY